MLQTPSWPAFHQGSQSVRLHAQLSRITAVVRLCYSIGHLQLSEYTYWWENQIIGQYFGSGAVIYRRNKSKPGYSVGGSTPWVFVMFS